MRRATKELVSRVCSRILIEEKGLLVGAEGFEGGGRCAAGSQFLVLVLELVELPVEAALAE